MKRFRKAVSALLALAMLVGLLPAVATPAAAAGAYNVKVKKSDASSYTMLYEGVTLPLGSTDNSSDIGINIISPYAPEIQYYAGTATSSSNTAVAELGDLSASLAHHICIKRGHNADYLYGCACVHER